MSTKHQTPTETVDIGDASVSPVDAFRDLRVSAAGTHFDYPRKDGQVEQTWVAGSAVRYSLAILLIAKPGVKARL